jgi:hypothetical protein
MFPQRTTAATVICLTFGLVSAVSPTCTVANHHPETEHGKTFALPPDGAKLPTGPSPS